MDTNQDNENWRLWGKMLLYGTEKEKDYAAKKMEEWFLEDQKRNLPPIEVKGE